MDLTIGSRLKHAWNAFLNRDPTGSYRNYGGGYSRRPDRIRLTQGNDRSIVTSVFNRIALDVATIDIKHCRCDENGRFSEEIASKLNNCLTLEANIDQTSKAFKQDIVMSMFDEGVIAIVPTNTYGDPRITNSYEVETFRTGKILEWYPESVKVNVYNKLTGNREDLILPKRIVGIIENPLYSVINERNSTAQRLIRKLSLLDVTDEQTASNKLDLIIQVPYETRSANLQKRAENRRKDIEEQLTGSKYGIAYASGTEKIVQLNRPVENNLMSQVEYLTNLLFSQLGMTQSILDGTADEKTMLNYYTRSVEPIVAAIADELKRKFLTPTARTQGQTIMYFRNSFSLVPVNDIAEIADKFTRNEIMTSNEIRQIIGMKPSNDPKADKLVNSNISQPEENIYDEENQNGINNEPNEEVNDEIYDYTN